MFRLLRTPFRAIAGHTGLALSIGEKIAIALALAMVPFAVVTWHLSQVRQPAIERIAEARDGLHYLNALLRAEVETARPGNGQAAATAHEAEQRYGGVATAELAHQIELKLANGAHAEAVHLMGELAGNIRRNYALEADDAADVGALRAAALEVVPALRLQARDLGAAATARGVRRLSEAEAGDLLRSLGALEALMLPLDDLAARTRTDAAAAPLAEDVSAARRSLSIFTQSLLSQARARRLDPAVSAPHVREVAASLITLESQAIIALDRNLGAHASALEAERWRTLLLGGVLIVAIFLPVWLVLRRTVVAPVRTLVDFTGSLAGGDYEVDITQQARDDEIGAIARFLETFREIAQSRMRAEIARQTAESANLAKSQFIANMSHELRTPLNAIIGYAEILIEDAEGADTRELERIHASARHLLTLINDILDVSKIEAGRMELLVEEIDPNALAGDVVDTLRPLAEKNGSRLVLKLPDAPAQVFRTDAVKLRQCLMNLLSNACKFTRDGQIKLTLETLSRDGAPALRFRVEDTGIGMTRQQMARLFQPFMQGDESVTREFGGTGLGLMLTRHMAHLMGGEVSVASEKGQGSTFTLWVSEAMTANAGAGPALASDDQADEPIVLLIEDERDAQALAITALTPLGFRPIIAATAAAGLEHARAGAPALIFLDINLPDRPGWSVLAALKADAKTAGIPVVVFSVDADRRTSAELGAAEHLVKPAAAELIAATALRLARRKPEAADDAAAGPDEQAASRRA